MTPQSGGYARGGEPVVPGTDAAIRHASRLERFELYVELYGAPVHIEFHKSEVPDADSRAEGTDHNER